MKTLLKTLGMYRTAITLSALAIGFALINSAYSVQGWWGFYLAPFVLLAIASFIGVRWLNWREWGIFKSHVWQWVALAFFFVGIVWLVLDYRVAKTPTTFEAFVMSFCIILIVFYEFWCIHAREIRLSEDEEKD